MRSTLVSTNSRLSSSTALTRPALLTLLATGAILFPQDAFAVDNTALPNGEQVIGGSASFDRSTKNVLNITQKTDRTVINWNRFDIGANATTQFYQPNSSSLAVNRVVGKKDDPTQILGSLKANGRIMVLDRNGVLFGKNSSVDVGGIVASTGDVDTTAVMRGDKKLILTDLGTTGEVVNNGTITVAEGGLAAFVAPTVRNNGVITAKIGKVALAAGVKTATVDLYGDGLVELAVSDKAKKILSENTGTITAEGGYVAMTAAAAKGVADTVVNMTGVVSASSAKMVGGKIVLSAAGGGTVKVSGKASASGTKGGSIKVAAPKIELTDSAVLEANATGHGNGGRVDVLADNSAIFRGRISAEGGELSGNGGLVEVSAGDNLVFTGLVSTAATNGLAGQLIIDPNTMTIHSGPLTYLLGDTNYLSASLLSILMSLNGTTSVVASSLVNVGSNSTTPGIGNKDIDLSSYWLAGWHTTSGNLYLQGNTVNFIKNLMVGSGAITVDATTLNINSQIYGLNQGAKVLLQDSKLNSSDSLKTINVLSNAASIQQAVFFANNGARINIKAGTYTESVNVNKSVKLYGDHAIVDPNSPGFYVTADSVMIDGFEITGAEDGILVDGADHVTLTNNSIHNNTGNGIKLLDSSFSTISGNTLLSNSGNGIYIVGGQSAKVQNNTMQSLGLNGVNVSGNTYVKVTGNSITSTSLNGILIDNSDYAKANSNSLSYIGNNGILLTGSLYANANNNALSNISNNGLLAMDSYGIDLIGNALSSINWSGIYVVDSDYADVINNTMSTVYQSGIQTHSSERTDIIGNSLKNVNGNGIVVGGGSYVDLVNNTIELTGLSGIYVEDSTNTDVISNDITSSGQYGVSVLASDFTDIVNNVIGNSGYYGVYVNGSYKTDIVRNKIDGSYYSGIRLWSNDSTDVIGNTISNTYYGDGIYAHYGNDLFINANTIRNSGDDGIDVSYFWGDRVMDAIAFSAGDVPPSEDTGSDTLYNVRIVGNTVTSSDNDGIVVYDVPRLLISDNTVSYSGVGGYDEGIRAYDGYYGYGDGIRVANYGDTSYYDGLQSLTDILNNDVSYSGDDGIEVDYYEYGRRSMPVDTPDVVDQVVDINIIGNSVRTMGDDGIIVDLGGGMVKGKAEAMTASPEPTAYYGNTYVNILIDSNIVESGLSMTPARVADSDYPFYSSYGDGIEVRSHFYMPVGLGYDSDPTTSTRIINNTVSNSQRNGIYISGPNHDLVELANNMLENNAVGARFESGQIDLTGAANTIYGGEVGLLFSPYIIGYEYPYETMSNSAAIYYDGDPIYAGMSLVNNTIGTTIFEDQSQYFVELQNGAFFDPGRPTILNGVDATYNLFSPSSQGGVLTSSQMSYLESMIQHYRDDKTLGLFFFGALPSSGPSASVPLEDVFRVYGSYLPNTPSGGLTITGLPRIGGGFGGGTGAGAGGGFVMANAGTTGADIANIEPAAGDETEGDQNGGNSVNTIEPAAGGEGNGNAGEAPCWNDATRALEQGTSVSYSFGDQGAALLDKAAACGAQNQ